MLKKRIRAQTLVRDHRTTFESAADAILGRILLKGDNITLIQQLS